jgi:GTP-binding protein EngB required for normal cell division
MDLDCGPKVVADVAAANGGGSRDLKGYEQLKFDLADVVREAGAKASELKNDDLHRKLRELLRRIAEDRFYLTVAGQFSRGKTTLLNAMLGMDRLPTGIVPITSVITAVSYDTHERVVLHFEGSHLTQDISLSELAEWITEQGNPGNRERIEMAEVQLPADILRRGAFLVDTPGLGSAIAENTQTTKDFLPQIDALLLVTSFEFPLSADEVAFFRQARSRRCKMFVIVNKLDLCPLPERERVLNFIRDRVVEHAGDREVAIFALSAFEALKARMALDHEVLERSGLPGFERALVHYLVTEKSRDFLLGTCDRLRALLTEFQGNYAAELRSRIEAIQNNVGDANHSRAGSDDETDAAVGVVAHQSVRITPCAICSQIAKATHDFMRTFQYDLAFRVETQLEHAAASGFCALHSWQYFRLASPQGMSAGYPKTIGLVAKSLRHIAGRLHARENATEAFNEILPNDQKCHACQRADDAEKTAIQECLRQANTPQPEKWDPLPSLCLMHLAIVVEAIPNKDLAARLTEHQASVFDRLGENLQRFALQHGASHWERVTDEEQRSPELSLNLLVGPGTVRISKKRPK